MSDVSKEAVSILVDSWRRDRDYWKSRAEAAERERDEALKLNEWHRDRNNEEWEKFSNTYDMFKKQISDLTRERDEALDDNHAASYHDMARQMAAARDERDEAQRRIAEAEEMRKAAEAALTRARADAIEEAAVVCDRWLSAWGAVEIDSPARPYACEVVANISEAIRDLAREKI